MYPRHWLTYAPSSGHQGRFGHEFLGSSDIRSLVSRVADLISIEFDFKYQGDGRSCSLRYANNSNYRNDALIRKESTYQPLHCLPSALLTRNSVRQLSCHERGQAHGQGK